MDFPEYYLYLSNVKVSANDLPSLMNEPVTKPPFTSQLHFRKHWTLKMSWLSDMICGKKGKLCKFQVFGWTVVWVQSPRPFVIPLVHDATKRSWTRKEEEEKSAKGNKNHHCFRSTVQTLEHRRNKRHPLEITGNLMSSIQFHHRYFKRKEFGVTMRDLKPEPELFTRVSSAGVSSASIFLNALFFTCCVENLWKRILPGFLKQNEVVKWLRI